MNLWLLWLFLLGVLGLFTYVVVRRSVENLTRTPVWLLWLVMMTPAFIWAGWMLANGPQAQMPLALMFGPFLLCPLVYWLLLLWGRPSTPFPAEPQAAPEAAVLPNGEGKATLRPVNREEEVTLQGCFPWSVYYLQNVEYRPQALICRGQLRATPEVAYATVRENVEAQFGSRFLVVFQEGVNGKPFFALVPNPQYKADNPVEVRPVRRPGLALLLLGATLLTTTLAGVGLTANVVETPRLTWSLLAGGLPYALAILAILGVHELAHYLTAIHYRIQATYPYFIPVPPVGASFPFGTFGAFIQMRSPVPNRKALFDVGISGPLAGFVVTVPLLLWGFSQSTVTRLTEESSILNFDSFNPSASLLLALFSKLALGNQLTAESALNLHPVAIAGCLGVIVTALNLMPVGQLDGGHIVHAMFGQRTGAMIGQVARLLVLGLSLVRQELLLWAILLFFMPVIDEPALNDVSELDNQRDLWGLLSLVLLVIIVLPAPSVLTRLLF